MSILLLEKANYLIIVFIHIFMNLKKISVLLCVSMLVGLPSVMAQKKQNKKPNIIFILADDLGYGDVGFNGQKKIKTPNLDQMAQEGMVLRQHYAGAPVCGPSRTCLLTGQHTGHTTVRGNPGWSSSGKIVVLKPEDVTVAEELKRANYQTALIGKWGMDEAGTSAQANAQGFDYFFGYRQHGEAHHYYPEYLWRNTEKVPLPNNVTAEKKGQYSHDLMAKEALAYIKKAAKEKNPFFLYLSFTTPHYELTVPEDSKTPYLNQNWEKRPMQAGHYYHDPEGNTTYAGMVSRMDSDIGRVRDLLKKMGIADNTLVIFSSDNGHEYDKGFFDSNGPFRGRKRDVYEGGFRVPFVAVWPGKIAPHTTSEHISAFWDFLPTACEVAKIQPNSTTLDGISYLPVLLGKTEQQKEHDYLYWEFNEGTNGPKQALRQGDWKLVKFFEKPSELYNLSKDIEETQNLAADYPEQVQKLEALLAQARTETPDYKLEKLTPSKDEKSSDTESKTDTNTPKKKKKKSH